MSGRQQDIPDLTGPEERTIIYFVEAIRLSVSGYYVFQDDSVGRFTSRLDHCPLWY
jgi:hypothetical protein